MFKGLLRKVFENSPDERFAPPPIKESIEGFEAKYEEIIEPLIEEGHYLPASFEVADMYEYLRMNMEELCLTVHSGLGYFAAVRRLKIALQERGDDLPKAIEYFKAKQAQTKLPNREE